MTKKILISGGPVHAYIDDVKIITNKFRGGLMAQMAENFLEKDDINVVYVCTKQSKQPSKTKVGKNSSLKIVYHNGIYDYMDIILELAPDMDAVILGAAIANLIPKNKIEGKFPSHNYKEGDIIPIDFTIAPRIIDRVKKIAPKTQLFGFKLLSGVNYDELISAAYGVLLESKATAVFANDAMDLMQKYVVTKERGVHPIHNNEVSQWILDRLDEQYYQTVFEPISFIPDSEKAKFMELVKKYEYLFTHTPEGYIFGCVAKRVKLASPMDKGKNSFYTTIRGKDETKDCTIVKEVEHDNRMVVVAQGHARASLNAPLLHKIFEEREDIETIVHYHGNKNDLTTQAYATPGTDKDSLRSIMTTHPSFNIKGHGCIISFDKEGNML